ncbi:hypothetical protein EV2_004498 [Malus domestica]
MGKNPHTATSDPDAAAAAADVRQEHLRTQVDDLGDSVAALESQHTNLQKSMESLNNANTTFQNTMTSQFVAFQSLMLEELRLIKSGFPPPTLAQTAHPHPPNPSPSHPHPRPPPASFTTTQTSNPTPPPSFRSLFANTSAQSSSLAHLPTYLTTTLPAPLPTTMATRPNPYHCGSPSPFTPHTPSFFSAHSQSFHLSPSTTAAPFPPNPSHTTQLTLPSPPFPP